MFIEVLQDTILCDQLIIIMIDAPNNHTGFNTFELHCITAGPECNTHTPWRCHDQKLQRPIAMNHIPAKNMCKQFCDFTPVEHFYYNTVSLCCDRRRKYVWLSQWIWVYEHLLKNTGVSNCINYICCSWTVMIDWQWLWKRSLTGELVCIHIQ